MSYSFCPKCGGRLETRFFEERDRLICSVCGFVFYQHSKACAGALVMRGDKLLLVKRGIEPFKGYWDIPGGFLEIGEAPADGARREIEEETGLLVELTEILGLFMDQYGNRNTATLNICYLAKVIGGQERASSDAEELKWFPVHQLPELIAFEWSSKALRQLQARF